MLNQVTQCSRWSEFIFGGLLAIGFVMASPTCAQRVMERLDRGLVAINRGDDGIFLTWRLLATDPADLAFDVFRQSGSSEPVKLNDQPLTASTTFQDRSVDLTQEVTYHVRPNSVDQDCIGGKATLHSGAPVREYLAVPIHLPDGYHANDASVGDLDGDGEYDIVIHGVGRGRDNSQGGMTTEPILQAYALDGSHRWTINLGRNIREGAHYTQFIVYDLDSDGVAEVVCKTADGTIDGKGVVIGDANADHRQLPPPDANVEAHNESGNDRSTNAPRERQARRFGPGRRGGGRRERFGYVLKGPEYLTVFDGRTGAALATVDYLPPRHPATDSPTAAQLTDVWGDGYGNRVDRFLACVAYLDGENPSVIMTRGYYTRTVLAAWDWRDGQLTSRWVFDSDQVSDQQDAWRGQGNHSIAVLDVDEDQRDEIIFGAMVVDDDGTGLYSTQFGHGDAQHTSDLDPQRPGFETWSIHEHPADDKPGVELRDTRTGEVIFAAAMGRDVGRGMAADIDPRYPGYEMWGGTGYLFDVQGRDIGPRPRSQNMAIWWDGDLLRELLDGTNIYKWQYQRGEQELLFDGRSAGVVANNGSKSNPCLSADILGDWREELLVRTPDSRELRIYVSTHPTPHRFTTLMHDPAYRLSVAWQNVAYNQPPHPGFFLGHGMMTPPRKAIRVPTVVE